MAVVIQCSKCLRPLNVLEAHLGKLVKCPACQATFTAAAAAPVAPPVAMPIPGTAPMPQPTVPMPAAAPPSPAFSYPAPMPNPFAPAPAPGETPPDDGFFNDFQDEQKKPGRGEEYHEEFDGDAEVATQRGRAHRGPLILGMGVVGLVFSCCFPAGWVFGGLALSLGASDLQEMSRGRMDRTGRSQTQAGRICGIAGAIIATLTFLYMLFSYLANTRLNT
jgi:hypothetical protein